MARHFDEDTILQLLLADNSDEENSSESEKEDYIEVDCAYESVSEDEVSSLTQHPPPGQDVQVNGHASLSIEDQIPGTSEQGRTELIIILSHIILRGKDKHKWSSLKPMSVSRTAARNIVHIRPGPTRMCKNQLDPLCCFSSFITDNMVNLKVTYTNAEIALKSEKYKNVTATRRPTDASEVRALIGILTLTAEEGKEGRNEE